MMARTNREDTIKYMKAYNESHREERRTFMKLWRARNKKHIKEYRVKYRAENIKKHRKWAKARYQRERLRLVEARRLQRQSRSPKEIIKQRARQARYHARTRMAVAICKQLGINLEAML